MARNYVPQSLQILARIETKGQEKTQKVKTMKLNPTEILNEILASILSSEVDLSDQTDAAYQARIFAEGRKRGFSDADIKSAIAMSAE